MVRHRHQAVQPPRAVGERLVETRSVDVHVGRLRGKPRAAGRQIETVIGLGYRFLD
jgi:DNA-binding response OmpR family regulator